jgi:hypothetical protein
VLQLCVNSCSRQEFVSTPLETYLRTTASQQQVFAAQLQLLRMQAQAVIILTCARSSSEKYGPCKSVLMQCTPHSAATCKKATSF